VEIPAGETFGLLGPNGAGKTTTLSMLSTLLKPSRGDVRVFGASIVEDPAEVRRRVGLAPQQISLYPKLNASVGSTGSRAPG
jgi:ABC-2 type transport system ATP-binding protein